MSYETSCGGVIFKDNKVLLIKNKKSNHWSFPKGHMEKGETKVMTAKREILEETNILVDIKEKYYDTICYQPTPNINKEVTYFLAFYKDGEIIPQECEISDIGWYRYQDAINLITYENEVKVLIDLFKKRNLYFNK